MTDLPRSLSLTNLQELFDLLIAEGFELYGPVNGGDAIVYGRIYNVSDLPAGLYDEQEPGRYRLEDKRDGRLFAHTTSPDSWKKYLFSKEEILYSVTENEGQLIFKTTAELPRKKAFIGIRSCDLHSLGIQDHIFLEDNFVDDHYASRRQDVLLVGVDCARSTATCFCHSLDTGPSVKSGSDIALSEIMDADDHRFLARSDSPYGRALLDRLSLSQASADHIAIAEEQASEAAQQQRQLPTENLKEVIYQELNNEPFWEALGQRCLHCANCTQVCPTCFCSSIEERTDLSGDVHERVRHWDSCFNTSHSYLVGEVVREQPSQRYRQWFSHKLASWQDQFDSLGCTGCGRCVTWCPVGIDITEEAHKLQSLQQDKLESP